MFILSLFLGMGISKADGVLPIQVVFMCRTEKGDKEIALFKQGDNFIYQYGSNMGAPELQLVRPSAKVIKEPWPGIGRNIWNNITLTNKEYSYTIRSSYDKMEDKSTSGVSISKNDAHVASVECSTAYSIVDNLSSFVE